LKGIGLDFDTEINCRITSKWNESFAELLNFKLEHGHLNVDVTSDLGKWCERQKDYYSRQKRNGNSLLTDEQVKKLKEIGLDLMTAAEKKFYSNIEELKKYKEEHGDYEVPSKSRLYKALADQKVVVSIFETCCLNIFCMCGCNAQDSNFCYLIRFKNMNKRKKKKALLEMFGSKKRLRHTKILVWICLPKEKRF
jgi:hypothetical protein